MKRPPTWLGVSRTAGRWASDVFILHACANRQAARHAACVIGRTLFEDTERGVFFDDELMLTPEAQSLGVGR